MSTRKGTLLNLIEEKGFLSINDAAKSLGVVPMTIRRYLTELEKEQLIERVYGGVVAKKNALNQRFLNDRIISNPEEKKEIATKALTFIKQNDTIIIDAGSTNHYFADILPTDMNLTVFTHSLDIANTIGYKHGICLMLVGGELNRYLGAFTGPFVEEQYAQIHADKCFLGMGSLCTKNDVFYDVSYQEIKIKELIVNNSTSAYILAEDSKKERQGRYPSLRTTDIDTIITESSMYSPK